MFSFHPRQGVAILERVATHNLGQRNRRPHAEFPQSKREKGALAFVSRTQSAAGLTPVFFLSADGVVVMRVAHKLRRERLASSDFPDIRRIFWKSGIWAALARLQVHLLQEVMLQEGAPEALPETPGLRKTWKPTPRR
jgi:hypothetical protein